jgi:2-succinyl-6-hydroxy-2,4-cyclohexadiene-1-carboxylate synthase
MSRIPINGVHLNIEIREGGPALLLLHGFTGSTATWAPHLDAWSDFTTIAVDLLGHGRSDCPTDAARYRVDRCVEDLVGLLDDLGVPRAAVLGYSMGGRVALRLALYLARHWPQRLWALVLESTSPGTADARERAARAQRDAAVAAAIERDGPDGIASFVDRWEALPLFATQRCLPARAREALRYQRLANNPTGLAQSLRGMSPGVQEPVLTCLHTIETPVLLLAGALDEQYCALARQMAAVFQHVQIETVPDAGHAIHLERPAVFAHTVRSYLAACVARPPAANHLKEEVQCQSRGNKAASMKTLSMRLATVPPRA